MENASPFVTIAQAAELLTVSEDTIFRMLNRGILESVKVGRLRRIYRASVEDIIEHGVRRIA